MSDPDFEDQLRQEQIEKQDVGEAGPEKERTKVDEDGTVYEWDPHIKAWFPKIDADFIAQYQMNYGVDTTTNSTTTTTNTTATTTTPPPDVNDPAYYYWYNHYYSQTGGATGTETTDTSSGNKESYEEYRKKYYEYYNQQKTNEKSSENQNVDAVEKDNTTTSESDSMSVDKSISGSESESLTAKTDKDGESTDITDNSTHEWTDEDWYNYYAYNGYDMSEYYGTEHADAADNPEVEGGVTQEADSDDKNGKNKKKGEKRKPTEKKKEEWFEIEEKKNTNVYVTGLPTDITDDEYKELMNKCGLIVYDPKKRDLKLKLYKDENGQPKGDGLCCYIKVESVELALQILDGSELRGHKISVELAQFELKGSFDPKKRRKLTNREKKKAKEKQAKLLDWRPDKVFDGTRPKNEKVLVIKNMFDPALFDKEPTLINEIRADLRVEGSNFGDVRKVVIYDRHPEGIATITFKEAEETDLCKQAMHGRWFAKRQIIAETWDGKTKYEVQETEEEREKRLKKWEDYLEGKKESEKTETETKPVPENQASLDRDKILSNQQDHSTIAASSEKMDDEAVGASAASATDDQS